MLKELLLNPSMASQFHVNESEDSMSCVPKASIAKRRDAELAALEQGVVSCIDSKEHLKSFSELYFSIEEVKTHVATLQGLLVEDSVVISTAWISNCGDLCVGALEVLGYADVMVRKYLRSF